MESRNNFVFSGAIFRDNFTVAAKFPQPGETLTGEDFFMGFGGKSANAAVMTAKLIQDSKERKLFFVGKVGDDSNGKDYVENFKSKGVDTSFIGVDPSKPTGAASIFVNSTSGENEIIIVPGASGNVSITDIEKAEKAFETAALMCVCLEMNETAVKAALRMGRKNSALTLLNAAPAKADLDSEFFDLTDILVVNETEAEIILETRSLDFEDVDVMKEACVKLRDTKLTESDLGLVVLTLGAKGAVVVDKKDLKKPALVRVPEEAKSGKVIDTTGAGDAFVGAFAFFLVNFRGRIDHAEMVRRSCHIASLSVQKYGTQPSYPEKAECPPGLFMV